MCDVGHYCPDGEGRVACPGNTTSPAGVDSGDFCFTLGKYLNCTFEEDLCGFTNVGHYNGNWKRGSSTSSWSYAPSVDHTTGTKDGFYAFYVASSSNSQQYAELKTPWVVVNQNDHATLQFYVQLKMYGDSSYNYLKVNLESKSGGVTTTLLTMTKTITDWTKKSLSITKFGELRIVFMFYNYYSYSGSRSYNAAIDDVDLRSANGCSLLGQTFKSFEHPKILPDIESYHDCLEGCLEQIDCAAFTYSSTKDKSCNLKAVGTSTELVADTSNSATLMSCEQGDNYCKAGEYKRRNDSRCYQCLPGTFRVAGSNISICDKCPLGTFSDETGASKCTNCNEGFFTAAEGSLNCTKCLPGSYRPEGSNISTCEQCPLGTFSDDAGLSQCKNCPKGFYTTEKGALNCRLCLPGSLLRNNSCLSCGSGTYSDTAGAADCKVCTPGSFSTPGSTSCTECRGGSYQPKEGQVSCHPCGTGSYSNAGASSCRSYTIIVIPLLAVLLVAAVVIWREQVNKMLITVQGSLSVNLISLQSCVADLVRQTMNRVTPEETPEAPPVIYSVKVDVPPYMLGEEGEVVYDNAWNTLVDECG